MPASVMTSKKEAGWPHHFKKSTQLPFLELPVSLLQAIKRSTISIP